VPGSRALGRLDEQIVKLLQKQKDFTTQLAELGFDFGQQPRRSQWDTNDGIITLAA
jgi:hypothetical protein